MPSPAPAPRHLQILGGTGKGKDGIERDVAGRKIAPDRGWKRIVPPKPDDLSVIAADYWDRVVPEMARVRMLKEPDLGALVMLCESYAIYHEARAARITEGVMGETASGTIMKHPAVSAEMDAMRTYRNWCHEFGLTPSAEMRVKGPVAQVAPDSDPFGG